MGNLLGEDEEEEQEEDRPNTSKGVPRVWHGVNQGHFQYFSEIIKSESVGLRAMVGAQSGPDSHAGAWGQPSWSSVSTGQVQH